MTSAREHPGTIAGLLAVAGLAWWWTVARMAGMDAAPGADLGSVGWFAASWTVMMAAMMLPSFAPALTAFLNAAPARWVPFTAGYLLVWSAVGMVAYGVVEVSRDLVAAGVTWAGAGRWLSAGVLVAAAAYELHPLKRACLTRCRGGLGDVRDRGWTAALVTGARSGGWCLGCSWALMAALFALGVMSLTWMVLIAVLVALEKAGPWPRAARVATATVLLALALGVALAPHDVPGLVVPGSGPMPAMKPMS